MMGRCQKAIETDSPHAKIEPHCYARSSFDIQPAGWIGDAMLTHCEIDVHSKLQEA